MVQACFRPALDQNGLQAAGMIYEYVAEGGITRLTAIYQNAPSLIGPMRSARFISLKLGRHYKGLLFQSGESQATRDRAAQDPTPQFFDTIGYQFRAAPPRYAPDNLMIKGPSVKAAQDNLYSWIPAFTIPKTRPALAGGPPAASINVDEHYSVYKYDPVMGVAMMASSFSDGAAVSGLSSTVKALNTRPENTASMHSWRCTGPPRSRSTPSRASSPAAPSRT